MTKRQIIYDPRQVPAHGGKTATVFLVNEAPGPDEADTGIPLYGQQGANLYHALRRSGIEWAMAQGQFAWPVAAQDTVRLGLKRQFLACRKAHITCTNAYDRWPRQDGGKARFCTPGHAELLSPANLERLRQEANDAHQVILICGKAAYLACTGQEMQDASTHERQPVGDGVLHNINSRLNANFKAGWYMGHTRRWLMSPESSFKALRACAAVVGWALNSDWG